MLNVLIAEDMCLLRGALVSLLALEPDIEVVAELSSGAGIVERAAATEPDVAVIDIDLPDLDGISAAAALRRHRPECRILIVSGLGSPGHVWRALDAGVSGYLLKDSDPQRLIRAIREVAAGGHMVDPRLVRTAPPGASALLTSRETEILRLAAEGYRTSDIALMLALSAGTVRNYLATVVSKLNARNRVDAIRIARAEGWLNWGTP